MAIGDTAASERESLFLLAQEEVHFTPFNSSQNLNFNPDLQNHLIDTLNLLKLDICASRPKPACFFILAGIHVGCLATWVPLAGRRFALLRELRPNAEPRGASSSAGRQLWRGQVPMRTGPERRVPRRPGTCRRRQPEPWRSQTPSSPVLGAP